MTAICDAARTYKRVVASMGSQMGKTVGLQNIIGQKLDDDPAPILYFGPTKSNIDGVIEPQIAAMLRSAPTLWAKTEKGRTSKKLIKKVGGVTLRLAWAGSPTELASQPAHTVLADEVDRMDPIPGEGDPITLAEARIATYPTGRIVITSTPTEGNVETSVHPQTGMEHWKVAKPEDVLSVVWRLWQEGTRFEWAVPCPECGGYFVPRFALLQWPKKASARRALKEARLLHKGCGALIEDKHRLPMNERGVFLAPGQQVVDGIVIGSPPDTDTASFWVSGLMSPFRSWGQRAAEFIDATASADQARIRVVINTGLGELYSFKGEADNPDVIRALAAPYATGIVPEAARWLTCGVDVQKRMLVYCVRAWSYRCESWLVEAGELHGETADPPIWNDLEELLNRQWFKAPTAEDPIARAPMTIRRTGIDSGYRPGETWRRPDNLIYEFCRRMGKRVVPTKGRDRMTKPLQPSLIDVTIRGVTHKQGLTLWHFDSDHFKSWLKARYTWPADQPGRLHVPQDVDEDYCLQMTSEVRVLKASGQATWVKVRQANHYFDCEVINVAMAHALGIHRKVSKREELVQQVQSAEPTPREPQMPPPEAPPKLKPTHFPGPPPNRRGNWIKNWG